MTTDSKRLSLSNHPLRGAFRDLRAMGLFAKKPLIGITLFLLGSLVFGVLAYGIHSNPALTQWDVTAAQAFHFRALNIPAPLMEYVIFGFFAGREVIVILGLFLAIYFLYKHFWREFAMIVLGPGMGGVLWYFLSRFFDRPRPTTQMDIILSDPSFPSGHALSAVLFYGLLAYLLVPRISSRFWKWAIALLLVFVTLFIGLSRLILGGHFVTDVIAGYAVGLAWAGLVYTLVERFVADGIVRNTESGLQNDSLAGLRSPGWFKKWPWLGVALILLGSLSFAALGQSLLTHGPLLQWDSPLYKSSLVKAVNAPPRENELMLFGFFLGKQVILVLVTILSVYFFYKRLWRELAMLLISSAGGSFVWNFFVNFFARPRPPQQTGLVITTVPSFPSGHAMSAIICYGFLMYVLIPKMPSLFWKWMVGLAGLCFILFVGVSRVFQGSHYLTDVLSGYALGLAWAALVYTLIEIIFMKRKV